MALNQKPKHTHTQEGREGGRKGKARTFFRQVSLGVLPCLYPAVDDEMTLRKSSNKGVNARVVERRDGSVLCWRKARKQGFARVEDEGGRVGGR